MVTPVYPVYPLRVARHEYAEDFVFISSVSM